MSDIHEDDQRNTESAVPGSPDSRMDVSAESHPVPERQNDVMGQSADPKDEDTITQLRLEIAQLKSRLSAGVGDGSETPDGLKRQYDSKLKDVMEKARDHAKKIAQERDELRRANEEKEVKLVQLKGLMGAANSQMEEKDGTIRDLEKEIVNQKQRCDKLDQQMKSMENHFTKPPSGPIEASLSVIDPSGVEWLLVGDMWWKKPSITTLSSVKQSLSVAEIRALEKEITRLNTVVASSESELADYKRKVEKVLKEKSTPTASTPQSVDSEAGVESARRLLKLEDELSQNASTIAALKKQISNLQASEKSLVAQVATAKSELVRLVEPVDKMESQIAGLKSDKKVLSEKLTTARETLSQVTKELEEAKISAAIQQNLKHTLVAPVVEEPRRLIPQSNSETHSVSVQTDLLPSILRSDHSHPTTPVPEVSMSTPRPEMVNTQHDAVAIPLRQQIKDLILELEGEKHEHAMTINQLHVVKEELRKMEAEKKLGHDLTDPVKVEYMRNVARRFIALAPPTATDEFEQLIPVILNFFGLEGDEAVSLMKERRKRIQETSSSLSFPKLW